MKSIWQQALMFVVGGLLAVGIGVTVTLAQEADESDEGRVVQIGPDEAKDPLPGEVDPRPRLQRQFQPWLLPGDPNQIMRQRRPASPYYIGVAAEKVNDQVRAHVDIPDGVGLMVVEVFDGSPADEGGVKQHDIILSADGNDLRELDDLINVVEEHASDGNMTQFTMEVLRHGQPQTVWVTPAERPRPERLVQPGFGEMPELDLDERDFFNRMMPRPGGSFGFNLPGFQIDQMPGNVSVRIERKEGEPARVTVERDGKRWEIEGDDPEALNELPEDLRPMVESMLSGQQDVGPMPEGEFGAGLPEDLREKIDEMQRQMRQLQQDLQDRSRQQDQLME